MARETLALVEEAVSVHVMQVMSYLGADEVEGAACGRGRGRGLLEALLHLMPRCCGLTTDAINGSLFLLSQ